MKDEHIKRPMVCPYEDCDGEDTEMVGFSRPVIDDENKWHQDKIAVKSICFLCHRFWTDIYKFDRVVKLSEEIEHAYL
jgi:hypothetical protein